MEDLAFKNAARLWWQTRSTDPYMKPGEQARWYAEDEVVVMVMMLSVVDVIGKVRLCHMVHGASCHLFAGSLFR